MKFYIAGSTQDRIFLQAIKLRLVDLGHDVSSSWLRTALDYSDRKCTAAHLKADGPKDLVEISACDVFALNMPHVSYGKMTELGAALALHKPVWLIGTSPKPNIFFEQCEQRFPHWCACFDYLEAGHGQ